MKNKLQNPIFILSVLLLLLNDFYLKAEYHNFLTGKLSDFSGLFAFPFFFSCLFPQKKKFIHIATAILFVFWKSVYCQVFIDGINGFGIPVTRVVDFTDNIALISIIASYLVMKSDLNYKSIKPALLYSIMFISLFSFTATSMMHRGMKYANQLYEIDEVYSFDFSREELISKINCLQKEYIDSLIVEYNNKKEDKRAHIFLDSIKNVYRTKYTDTICYFIDYEKIKQQDTIDVRYNDAYFQVYGNDRISYLRLIEPKPYRQGISKEIISDLVKGYSLEKDSSSMVENVYFRSLDRNELDSILNAEKQKRALLDTIWVPRKTKMPVWTYYDHHTIINGLSFGFGELRSKSNVINNGIKIEVPGSSSLLVPVFPLILFSPDISKTEEFNPFAGNWISENVDSITFNYKNRIEITNGLSFSAFGSISPANIVNGLQITGFFNSSYKSNGFSVAGFASYQHMSNGIQVSGIGNFTRFNNGLQLGGLWATTSTSNGLLIGTLVVKSDYATGAQIGAYNNVTALVKGLQLGGYNRANEVRGLQIGIYNSAKSLKGIQLGLWNKSNRRSLPFINWGF